MKTVEVKAAAPYNVNIGEGLFKELGKKVKGVCSADKVLVVSDSNVAPLYLDRAINSLSESGFDTYEFIFSAGEKFKNIDTFLDIIDCLGANCFKRTDAIVALGGGVVGDAAGFAAATYMRGIAFVQVPTTLLAMIDSAVGGKTAVDLKYGKNLLGAFHQPIYVLADIELLDTLPGSEWKNGIGEGIKYACLAGGRLYEIMSGGLDRHNLDEFVALCVDYKSRIVAADEKERGMRKLLNLGHTIGHAIEKLSEYDVAHGVAVAVGISVMAKSAFKSGELQRCEYEKIVELLEKYGFDGDYALPDMQDVSTVFMNDKKAQAKDIISIITINGLGKCVVKNMSIKQFMAYINT